VPLLAVISNAGVVLKLLGIPSPYTSDTKTRYVLVYGGSTAVATITIQLWRE
jgi:NADPH:quinone reductase-like Zn-dependent oxidoreductase